MKPAFSIKSDDRDLTANIAKRLIRLSVKDEAGITSDSLQIVLCDHPPLALPKPGLILQVAMGYEDRLVEVGSYAIKPVSLKVGPSEMTIEGSAADQKGALMSQKERSWKSKSLKSIVEAIAGEQGLQASVSGFFDSVMISHEDQTESDLAFLTRLAKRHDAVFKVQFKKIGFLKRGKGESTSGKKIPPVVIRNPKDLTFKSETETKYTGVRAHYWNGRNARRKSVLVGREGRIHDLRFTTKNEATAREAANSKFREIRRKSASVAFEVPGNLDIYAEREVEISGVRPEVDGPWVVASVEHTTDGVNIFSSKVTCERKVDD